MKLHALDFLDLGRLALQGTQVVQLGATHLAVTDDLHMVHTGRMDRERTLDANAVGHAANRKGFAHAAVAHGNHSTLKRLKTLAAALHNLDLHAHGVANGDLGQIGTELRCFDRTDDFAHGMCLLPS